MTPRILAERANGHTLPAIRTTGPTMKRQWDKIRRHDWGWMHKTLKATGPNGPLPPEKPKAPKKAVVYHQAPASKEKPKRPGWSAEMMKAIAAEDQAAIDALNAEFEGS